MRLNEMGITAESLWCRLPEHFTNINLDTHAIMPNHIHGIMHITKSVGAKQGSSASPGFCGNRGDDTGKVAKKGKVHGMQGTASESLCAVIQNFKSVAT